MSRCGIRAFHRASCAGCIYQHARRFSTSSNEETDVLSTISMKAPTNSLSDLKALMCRPRGLSISRRRSLSFCIRIGRTSKQQVKICIARSRLILDDYRLRLEESQDIQTTCGERNHVDPNRSNPITTTTTTTSNYTRYVD